MPVGIRTLVRLRARRKKFWKDFHAYRRLAGSSSVQPQLEYLWPCLADATQETPVDPSYFYQDAWAFRQIVQNRPSRHVDVGSHHKFVSLLAQVVPVTMVELRPINLPLEGLEVLTGSVLAMPFSDGSQSSVSSLCVVEHIGLGRYGDPLDPAGSERALEELKRIVAPGGNLYVSVPVDDADRIYFNAHRAFTEGTLRRLFAPFEIVSKGYIYGERWSDELAHGFGTGCYHLRRPLS